MFSFALRQALPSTSSEWSGLVPQHGSSALWVLGLLCAACGQNAATENDGTSGAPSTGGLVGTGGSISTGGSSGNSGGSAQMTGGVPSGGDASGGSSGGVPSGGGGAEASGGVPSESGGAPGSGGSNLEGTYVPDPSWSCGMPEGMVDPQRGELVFRLVVEMGETHDMGETQYGNRTFSVLEGGATEGTALSASLTTGGLDFELRLSNGTVELEQVATLRAADGSYIYLRTCGIAPAGESVVRIVPDFEVANQSSLSWLNTGTFVGTRTVDAVAREMELSIYDVSMVTDDAPRITWEDPPGVPQQPFECLELSGNRGAEVFTESVGIGSSLSVGASKRGTRNIIPITGGTVSGRFEGSVVPAGADYQLLGTTATLDARYALRSNDDEFVIVRNCGPFGALVPLFEAREEGPYSFLNENRFVSSDPGSAPGGVSITFYELQ